MLAEKDKLVTEEKELLLLFFNDHYVNIAGRSCGTKTSNVTKEQEIEGNKKSVEVICMSFVNHESIEAIKENNIKKIFQRETASFQRFSANSEEILIVRNPQV